MNENVGIVIVSHSADVARGTAMMVEQMVGREVPLGQVFRNLVDNARKRVLPFSSTLAARKPTARWRSRC